MMWGEEDLCFGLLAKDPALQRAGAGPGPLPSSLALQTTVRLCQQVYREYQRQLFDLDGWYLPGIETVGCRDCVIYVGPC